jgi:chromosomal replication initiator protein
LLIAHAIFRDSTIPPLTSHLIERICLRLVNRAALVALGEVQSFRVNRLLLNGVAVLTDSPERFEHDDDEATMRCSPVSREGSMTVHSAEGRDRFDPDAGVHTPVILEESLRSAVSDRVGATRFALWFGGNVRLGLNREGDSLIVRVPDSFFRDWIERHYTPSLIDAVEAVVGRQMRISVEVDGESEQYPDDVAKAVSGPPEPSRKLPLVKGLPTSPPGDPKVPAPLTAVLSIPVSPKSLAFDPSGVNHTRRVETASTSDSLILPESSRRPFRRLEDFVAGPGNRMALAAAAEMARTAGFAFNPLMIHSAIGLGKSHLLEGINHSLRQVHPRLQIIQLNAEAFTNSFLESMRSGTLNGFRARFRGAGGLIVDDVQFLAAKRATMIEFLYTFDALYNKGAPIILAADQHPRQISRLTDELVTRFLAGMVVSVESPDLITRQAILRAKATARGVEVPEVVVAYIAEHLRASIRELEGALYTVIAQAILTGRRLDLTLAQSALRDSIRHTTASIGVRDVERVVCNLFQIKADAIKSESRAQALAYPRMIAMFLCRKHLGAAYSEIGRYFGGRNHTTVIAAEKKVNKWLKSEKRLVLLPGFETVADLLSDLERALGTS